MVEEWHNLGTSGDGGRLLLTKEEWVTRMKQRHGEGPSNNQKFHGNSRHFGKQPHKFSDGGARDGKDGARDISWDKCHNCGKLGHWDKECHKTK